MKRALTPLAIVTVGVVVAVLLASAREAPEREERQYPGPLVEAVAVATDGIRVVVRGNGTVQPKTAVQVVPQVSGKVVAVHDGLVPGGVVPAGEAILTVDPADFELAVQRAEAAVAQASVQLQLEDAEAALARREWETMNPGQDPPPLVVREPQVNRARAELKAARAELAGARLALERTRVTLPFAIRVTTKNIDLGQFAVAGQQAAAVYATASMEVPVPLADEELEWFEVPPPGSAQGGARAEVSSEIGGRRVVWPARVVRTEGEVDRATRTVSVVVEVPRPVAADAGVTLVPGTFVDVDILGRVLDGVVAVPRHALHGGSVWIVEDGRLRIREVEVARRERDRVIVARGLADGDVVITSQLDVVTDGMKVRVAGPRGEPVAAAGTAVRP